MTERSFIPTLESTTKLVAWLEEFYPNSSVRLLILVRTVKEFRSEVPKNQMEPKPLVIIIPSILEPDEPVPDLQEQISRGVVDMKKLITGAYDNEYWRFTLASEMLVVSAQKELRKRNEIPYITLGSLPSEEYDRIEVAPLSSKKPDELI